MDLIRTIADIFRISGIETEIIAASVRNPIHVIDCALAGADIATVPYGVLEQMTKHPLTEQGIEKFQADYRAVLRRKYSGRCWKLPEELSKAEVKPNRFSSAFVVKAESII